jgi:hypothetical protein
MIKVIMYCCRAAKLPFTNNERKTKSSRTKTKTKTQTQAEENRELFLHSEFLKSRSPLQVLVRLLL